MENGNKKSILSNHSHEKKVRSSFYIHDARNIKDKITDKIVNAVITSPPYFNLKNYNVENQIGFGQNYETYLEELQNIFSYCANIVKDSGSLWVIIDTFREKGSLKLLPFDLVKQLKDEWILQDILIWVKDKTRPWSAKGKFRKIYEYILFFTKKGSTDFVFNIDKIKVTTDLKKWWVKYPERYNPKGKTPVGVWSFPLPDYGIWEISIPVQGTWGNGWVKHACPFPPELIERILLLTTNEGDVVLDPFAGSGSVIAQARVMGRKAIGFDINPKYKKMYIETVYPEFKQQWKIRKKEIRKMEINQKILQEKIIKLRKLKYPKELIKKSLKAGFPEEVVREIHSIFLIDGNKEDDKVNLYLIFMDKVPGEERVSELWKVISQKPLSSYGFKPNIGLISVKSFIKQVENIKIPAELYQYNKGKTYYYEKKISFEDWLKEKESEKWKENYWDLIPPILSNIEIREKVRELTQQTLFQ